MTENILSEADKKLFPCPLCGRDIQQEFYPDTLGRNLPALGYDFTPGHTRTYRLVFCGDCRHGFSSPRPTRLWEQYKDLEDSAYLER